MWAYSILTWCLCCEAVGVHILYSLGACVVEQWVHVLYGGVVGVGILYTDRGACVVERWVCMLYTHWVPVLWSNGCVCSILTGCLCCGAVGVYALYSLDACGGAVGAYALYLLGACVVV